MQLPRDIPIKPGLITDPFSCQAGGIHEFIYLGKESGNYRCSKCACYISKVRLKRLTDHVEVEGA